MTDVGQMDRRWVLAALMLTMALAAMDTTIVSTVIPPIVADLGGFTKISWVFSIYLLAQTITIPIYGKLADQHGRKKVLIGGVVLFLIGSAASAGAWNIGSLIAFRGLQGLGAGSIMATVNTIAGDIYTVEERARVQGYLSSIWGISAVVGPALGGALAEYADWRWIFLINLPIGSVAIWFLAVFFKEEVPKVHRRTDLAGALLITACLSLFFILLLEGGGEWPWWSVQTLVLGMAVVGLGWAAWRVEGNSPHAMVPVWVWKNRTFAFTNLAVAGLGITMMGPETFLPTFTQASLGIGITASGFILASMSIGWPTASALSGKLYLRIGFRETALIGTATAFIATMGFFFLPYPQPIWALVAGQVLLGAGFGLIATPSMVGIQSMVGWEHRGVVTGANVFTRNLGQAVGAGIMGALFNHSIRQELGHATSSVPDTPEGIMARLKAPDLPQATHDLLAGMINSAMHQVYLGMAIVLLLSEGCLFLVPHCSPQDRSLVKPPQPVPFGENGPS